MSSAVFGLPAILLSRRRVSCHGAAEISVGISATLPLRISPGWALTKRPRLKLSASPRLPVVVFFFEASEILRILSGSSIVIASIINSSIMSGVSFCSSSASASGVSDGASSSSDSGSSCCGGSSWGGASFDSASRSGIRVARGISTSLMACFISSSSTSLR